MELGVKCRLTLVSQSDMQPDIHPKLDKDSVLKIPILSGKAFSMREHWGMKTAAFFDLDNTLIRGSSLLIFARSLVSRGILPKHDLSKYLIHNLRFIYSKTEKLQIVEKLAPTGLRLLRGKSHQDVKELCEEIVEQEISSRLLLPVNQILKNHQSDNVSTWLVTATPMELALPIARKLGMSGALGTVCEVHKDRYTGGLLSPILHGRLKAAAVREICFTENYQLENSYAYSDSISDLPLLSSVGKPVVVNPNSELRAVAAKNNWKIQLATKVAA